MILADVIVTAAVLLLGLCVMGGIVGLLALDKESDVDREQRTWRKGF